MKKNLFLFLLIDFHLNVRLSSESINHHHHHQAFKEFQTGYSTERFEPIGEVHQFQTSQQNQQTKAPVKISLVGGEQPDPYQIDARPGQFGEIVSLRLKDDPTNHYGAGIILNERWILTLRRNLIVEPVFNEIHKKWFGLVLNDIIVYPSYEVNKDDLVHHDNFTVWKTFCHPLTVENYPSITSYTDIGLIWLKKSIHLDTPPHNFTSRNPGGPYPESVLTGRDQIYTVGWPRATHSNSLIVRKFVAENQEACRKSDKRYHPDFHWCLKPSQSYNICGGEQGGPAVEVSESGLIFAKLIGITAFSSSNVNCCFCSGNSFFIKLKPFIKWIRKVMRNHTESDECIHLLDHQKDSDDSKSQVSPVSHVSANGSVSWSYFGYFGK